MKEVIPDSFLSIDLLGESCDDEDNRPGQMNDILKHTTLDDESVAEISSCPIENDS